MRWDFDLNLPNALGKGEKVLRNILFKDSTYQPVFFHSLLVFRCLLSSQQSVSLGPIKPSFYSNGPSPQLHFHLFRFLTETCRKPCEKVRVLESILSKLQRCFYASFSFFCSSLVIRCLVVSRHSFRLLSICCWEVSIVVTMEAFEQNQTKEVICLLEMKRRIGCSQ